MINGVPYPIRVKDEESLIAWLTTIDREVAESTSPSALTHVSYIPNSSEAKISGHREVYHSAYFKEEDAESEAFARALVCQQMAMSLFFHLINAPKGKLVWRVRPEFDVSHDTIPADLSQVMTRAQIEAEMPPMEIRPISLEAMMKAIGKEDWAVDFGTDSIYLPAAPLGAWRQFKSYMRYSVVVGDEVIQPIWRAA